MRLFIAIRLSDEIRRAVVRAQLAIQRQGIHGNFSPDENLHLTLAFIGEYSDVQYVLDTMASIHLRPFELTLHGIGAFGDLWWVGLERSEALRDYVRDLRRALSEAEIPFDDSPFVPHITMARKVDAAELPDIAVERASMVADHAALMCSNRGVSGMIYTEIF